MNVVHNTLWPRRNGHHIPDDIFKYIFVKENVQFSSKISLKYVLWYLIDNNAALVQIMAAYMIGGKPLSEPMMS